MAVFSGVWLAGGSDDAAETVLPLASIESGLNIPSLDVTDVSRTGRVSIPGVPAGTTSMRAFVSPGDPLAASWWDSVDTGETWGLMYRAAGAPVKGDSLDMVRGRVMDFNSSARFGEAGTIDITLGGRRYGASHEARCLANETVTATSWNSGFVSLPEGAQANELVIFHILRTDDDTTAGTRTLTIEVSSSASDSLEAVNISAHASRRSWLIVHAGDPAKARYKAYLTQPADAETGLIIGVGHTHFAIS